MALVGLGDEAFEITQCAVLRVHGVIIPDRIRAAEFAFAEFFSDRMDRHDPKDGHAQILQLVQPGGDAVEISRGGKVARKNFVNHAVMQPCRGSSRWDL